MNSTARKIFALTGLIAVVTSFSDVVAQSGRLVREVQTRSLPVAACRMTEFQANPAAMSYRDSMALSVLSASGDYLHEEKAAMEQLGRGHSLFALGARSYMPVGSGSTAWGGAEFVTGLYRDLRWTDCIDYERVAPYVLGDEVGGNLSTRRYSFSGGYARVAGAWSFGAHAAYRAEMAYRNRDPRVKTVVSDLDIDLGVTRKVSRTHVAGLSAGLNVYRQNCDLDFYNPVNQIQTYTLTGMGTYYRRFMGNTNKNSGYESVGYRASLQFLPVGGSGLSVSAGFSHYRMEQRLRNFNNLTLGFTGNDIVDFSAAYSMVLAPSLLFAPRVSARLFSRDGTENLFGTSAGASYEKIGSRKPYAHKITTVSLDLPLQIGASGRYLTLTPSATYSKNRETYNDPVRLLSVSQFTPRLDIDGSLLCQGKWLLRANIGGEYRTSLSDTSNLGDLDVSTSLGQCVVNNFAMLKASRLGLDAGVSVSREIGRILYGLSLGYNMADYRDHGTAHGAIVTLSATF